MSLEGGRRPARARKAVTHYSDDNPSTFTVKRKKEEVEDLRGRRRDKRAAARTFRRHSSGSLSPPRGIPSSIRTTSSSSSTHKLHARRNSEITSPKRKRPRVAEEVIPDPPREPDDELLAHRVTIQPVLRPKAAPTRKGGQHRTALQQLAAHGRWNYPKARPHEWKPLPAAFAHHTLQSATGEQIRLPPAALTAMCRHDEGSPYWFAGNAAGHVVAFDTRSGRSVRTLDTAASAREATRVMTSKTVVSFPNLIHAITARGATCVVWTAQELQALHIPTGETTWSVPLKCTAEGLHAPQVTAAAAAAQSLDLHSKQPVLLWQKPDTLRPTKHGPTEKDAKATLFCIDWALPAQLQWKAIQPDAISQAAVWDAHDNNAVLQVATTVADVWELRRIDITKNTILDRTTLHNPPANNNNNNQHPYSGCRMQQAADYLFLCTNRGIRCYDAARFTFLTVYGETVALHGKTVGWQDCFWLPEPAWPHTVWQEGAPGANTKGSGSASALSSSSMTQASWLLTTQDELARRRAVIQQHRHVATNQLQRQSSGACGATGSGSNSADHQAGGPSTPTSKNLFSNMLLVGCPHPHRGPTELQSTLYVWKPGQVLPLTTLQAPAGGLLGLVATAHPVHGWQLTAATAAHGQAWEFRAGLQSDFPGNMYPTHYQVINDNVEYLEDEDELDKGGVTSASSVRDDASSEGIAQDEEDLLQRALRESFVDEGKIDVLATDDDADENALPNPFAACVPAWPNPSLRPASAAGSSSSNGATTQQSPSRFHDSQQADPELFRLFPQWSSVKREKRRQALETSQAPRSGTPTPPLTQAERIAILTKASKGKRSRTANIDVLLQASIDPSLRQEMTTLHKQWSDGSGSRLKVPPSRSTAEEKELALELLFLGPGSRSNSPKENGARSAATSSNGGTNSNCQERKNLKEPPEPPKIVSTSSTDQSPPVRREDKLLSSSFCAACKGRMVFHSCGKREKPVDVEALERAEAERKAAEEAEKQRQKAEKRRAAEAKRREARKKKKEEEERKRREEELQRLEEERVAAMQKPAQEVSTAYTSYASFESHRKIPRYADLMAAPVTHRDQEYSFGFSRRDSSNGTTEQGKQAKETYARQDSSNVSEQSTYSSNSFTPAAVEPLFKPEDTTPLDEPTYQATIPAYQTSISVTTSVTKPLNASDGDALAVLAGLADQAAKPTSSWRNETSETNHYDYSGAEDRRRAILNQYHHSLHSSNATTAEERSFSVYDRPSSYDGYPYNSESTRPVANGGGLLYFNHKPKADESK